MPADPGDRSEEEEEMEDDEAQHQTRNATVVVSSAISMSEVESC
jgi:hypothetical protein